MSYETCPHLDRTGANHLNRTDFVRAKVSDPDPTQVSLADFPHSTTATPTQSPFLSPLCKLLGKTECYGRRGRGVGLTKRNETFGTRATPLLPE